MRPASTITASMNKEWRTCPRCKTKILKPELIMTELNGSDKVWWVCENFVNCNFPLDMPSNIYHVTQTAYQKQQKCMPLPNIEALPDKYRYMYPLTFSNSRPPSRCSSVLSSSNPSNSRNETTTIDSLDGTISEKSSGQNRLKAESVHSESINNTNTPSTSAVQSAEDIGHENDDNIDEDIEAAATKRTTCRIVRRKRYHDSNRSWAALIEKVASDPKTSNSIINMEESELFLRMKEFFDDHYFRRSQIFYKRPPTRVTYRIDDVENCLRAITREDWKSARRRIPQMSMNEQMTMRTSNAEELLKSVGIDVQKIKKAVGEKVGNVMRGFSAESVAKRRKIEEERKIVQKQRKATLKNTIHQSVSARILNKKLLRKDEEERSQSSTPTPYDIPQQYDDYPQQQQEGGPVQFHLGDSNYEEQVDQDQQWGFDLDGLYESIHAQNNQNGPMDPVDPVEAILAQLDDPQHDQQNHHDHDLLMGVQQHHENSGDEGEDAHGDDDDFTTMTTGFGDNGDDFSSNNNSGLDNSNFDFVNDNFGF